MMNDELETTTHKVIFLGDSGVGKTEIISKFLNIPSPMN